MLYKSGILQPPDVGGEVVGGLVVGGLVGGGTVGDVGGRVGGGIVGGRVLPSKRGFTNSSPGQFVGDCRPISQKYIPLKPGVMKECVRASFSHCWQLKEKSKEEQYRVAEGIPFPRT